MEFPRPNVRLQPVAAYFAQMGPSQPSLLAPSWGRQPIDRTADGPAPVVQDVGLTHRRTYILVPERLLDRPNVVAVFEQVGREHVLGCLGANPIFRGGGLSTLFQTPGTRKIAVQGALGRRGRGHRVPTSGREI